MKPSSRLEVSRFASSGEGVGRLDGAWVGVQGTIPGEQVTVRREGKRVTLVSVDAPSPDRVEPRCPVVDRCGGCAWQHVAPHRQMEARVELLRRALPPALRDMAIETVASPVSYGWRIRARLAWHTKGGHAELGFRARADRTLINLPGCPVLHPAMEAAMPWVRDALAALPGRGECALALGRDGRAVASIHPEAMPSPAAFVMGEALVAKGMAGVAMWPPGATAPVVHGDPRPCIDGADGVPLVAAPDGFTQAHGTLNPALARFVAERAATRHGTVTELYAGAGNLTVLLARDARKMVAVEDDREAAAALRENLAARSIDNVRVQHASAEERTEPWGTDVVVLDPPRTGARAVCEMLVKWPVKRVVMVSCDPATLGRDLATLASAYEVESLTGFEMFPHTPHLETVAVLRRGSVAPR